MYVCICNAVTEHQIECAVAAGARCVRSIREATAAGAGCGTCVDRVKGLVARAAAAEVGWTAVGAGRGGDGRRTAAC